MLILAPSRGYLVWASFDMGDFNKKPIVLFNLQLNVAKVKTKRELSICVVL